MGTNFIKEELSTPIKYSCDVCVAGGGGGPGGWCSAIVTVPYAYYRQFGYGDILRRAIPAMKNG